MSLNLKLHTAMLRLLTTLEVPIEHSATIIVCSTGAAKHANPSSVIYRYKAAPPQAYSSHSHKHALLTSLAYGSLNEQDASQRKKPDGNRNPNSPREAASSKRSSRTGLADTPRRASPLPQVLTAAATAPSD